MKLFCRCGRRKVWFVYTYGHKVEGGVKINSQRISRPFNRKAAAVRYRDEWDSKFEGYAVVDYRLMSADELMFADTEQTC